MILRLFPGQGGQGEQHKLQLPTAAEWPRGAASGAPRSSAGSRTPPWFLLFPAASSCKRCSCSGACSRTAWTGGREQGLTSLTAKQGLSTASKGIILFVLHIEHEVFRTQGWNSGFPRSIYFQLCVCSLSEIEGSSSFAFCPSSVICRPEIIPFCLPPSDSWKSKFSSQNVMGVMDNKNLMQQ